MNAPFLSWFLLILLSLIWGSSFVLMKRGLETFTSEQVAALRIVIAFLFLLPLLIKHYKINLKKYWFGILLMGVFGNLIPAFLFTKAETGISSALTGMLNALTPVFVIIIGVVLFKNKVTLYQTIGVIIGFIGALLLVGFDSGDNHGNVTILCALLVVIATLCYAISVNSIKKYLSDINAISATVWAFTFIGLITIISPFIFDLFLPIEKQNHLWVDILHRLTTLPNAWISLGYIGVLAIVGSAISVILFNILIKKSTPVFAASCTYLIPIVAIMWGLFEEEKIVWQQAIAVLVVLIGIWLINKKTTNTY